MKKEILRILRNSNEYISGQELCSCLNVSRTMIWKIMNQLKEEGYMIDSVSNRGYLLLENPDILSKEEIESRIDTKLFGRRVEYIPEVDSTNTYGKRIAEEQDTHGTLVVAEMQNSGKGRRGKQWDSPKGTGIWMSLILKPNFNPQNASMITLVAGLGVAMAIQKLYQTPCQIKWPNDIVLNKRKICGILTEISTEIDMVNHLVVGIGINANTQEFPAELEEVATSISKEIGRDILRSELIAQCMKEIEYYYHIFMKTQDLRELVQDYNDLLISKDKHVFILEGEVKYEAKALGINVRGELEVLTKDGKKKNIYAGEVSVRGIYNYV